MEKSTKEIKKRIEELKKEKDAIILAHYYTPKEVQKVADHVGDSYYLSKVAEGAKEKVILFCGVHFMGESAKLLSPNKTVLMPDLSADCPMAHMASEEDIKNIRAMHPDAAVVCYINSTAKVKEYSDVCVTSSNALRVVRNLPNEKIYFVPDQHLGRYISGLIPEKTFILNQGFCFIHHRITKDDVIKAKKLYPKAKVAAHPECREEVIKLSDYVGSTSGIINYVKSGEDTEYIICTETGVFYEIEKQANNKKLYPARQDLICPGMKKNTLPKVLKALEEMKPQVLLPKGAEERALRPLKRMLQLSAEAPNERK
jgi:quinolinate synthase